MNFLVDAKAWGKAVGRCAGLLSKNALGTRFNDVLVAADPGGQKAILSSTDGVRWLTLGVASKVESHGAVAVRGGAIDDQSGAMSGEMRVKAEGDRLVMADERGTQSCAVVPDGWKTFPDPKLGGDKLCGVTLEGAALAGMLKHAEVSSGVCHIPNVGLAEGVIFDAVSDGSAQELGVLAVSNAHAVFCRHRPEEMSLGGETRFVAATTADALKTLAALCKDKPGPLRIVFFPGLGQARFDDATYTFPLLAKGCVVPWRGNEGFSPTGGDTVVSCEAKALVGAIERASACLPDDEVKGVAFKMSEFAIVVKGRGPVGSGESACDCEGPPGLIPAKFMASAKLLLAHLKAFGEGPVKIIFTKRVVAVLRDNVTASVAIIGKCD